MDRLRVIGIAEIIKGVSEDRKVQTLDHIEAWRSENWGGTSKTNKQTKKIVKEEQPEKSEETQGNENTISSN